MKNIGKFMYSLSLALWVGGISVFTFLVTPKVFGSFERDEASRIVNALFEVYFGYVLAVTLLSLLLFLVVMRGRAVSLRGLCTGLLAAGVLISVYTTFSLYPEIKQVKARVASFVTEPEDTEARREFGRLHAVSAVLNLLVLADGAALLYLNVKDSD